MRSVAKLQKQSSKRLEIMKGVCMTDLKVMHKGSRHLRMAKTVCRGWTNE